MNVDRIMLVEAVLDGKISSDILTQSDLDNYQFLVDSKSFFYKISEMHEKNPTMTFSEVEFGAMN